MGCPKAVCKHLILYKSVIASWLEETTNLIIQTFLYMKNYKWSYFDSKMCKKSGHHFDNVIWINILLNAILLWDSLFKKLKDAQTLKGKSPPNLNAPKWRSDNHSIFFSANMESAEKFRCYWIQKSFNYYFISMSDNLNVNGSN